MVAELVAERDALAAKIARMYEQKPVEIKAPSYDHHAMGCGLKDRNITDCYEAMGYGWDCALELMFDQIGGPLYARPVPAAQAAEDRGPGHGCSASTLKQRRLNDGQD